MLTLFPFDRKNILPCDGECYYFGSIFSSEQSDFYLKQLVHEIYWENDEIILFGKKIITNRKVAWYGDNNLQYTYSKVTKTAKKWTNKLLKIKEQIEFKTGEQYNSCLLNLYHNGQESMGWHSDDESMLKQNGSIASISFGANRYFHFKHKTKNNLIKILLEHGSLLEMRGTTQTYWKHCLPKSKKINTLRINLTFRNIVV